MTIKKTDQNPVFGLAAKTGQKIKADEVPQNSLQESLPTDDADDAVHLLEEKLSYEQFKTADPDELVHRMNTFKPGKSLTTDPDDEIHQHDFQDDLDEH